MEGNKYKRMKNNILILIFFVIIFNIKTILAAEETQLAKLNLSIGTPGGGKITIRPIVKPIQYFKDKEIVKQKYDFSCGSAAASTILKYYLNIDNVTEEIVMNGLFQVGNIEKIIERKGFSLLDMKKLFEALGYRATGYRTDIIGLVSLGKPAILAIKIGTYQHFVIFRGIHKGRVFLADPALGNTLLSIEEFQSMWVDNVALVVYSDKVNENFTKIKKEDLLFVPAENLRNSIFFQTIPTFRSFSEF